MEWATTKSIPAKNWRFPSGDTTRSSNKTPSVFRCLKVKEREGFLALKMFKLMGSSSMFVLHGQRGARWGSENQHAEHQMGNCSWSFQYANQREIIMESEWSLHLNWGIESHYDPDEKIHFTINPRNLINAFMFKLPSKDFESLSPENSMDYFIELQVSDTGHSYFIPTSHASSHPSCCILPK